MKRLVLVPSLLLVALPGVARAATVSVVVVPNGGRDGLTHQSLQFQAAPGEANDVTASPSATGTTARIHDGGATLTAGSGCVAEDDHTARCRVHNGNGVPVAGVLLGDGDDTFDTNSIAATGRWSLSVSGEGGNDDLSVSGRPGFSTLEGGDGNDQLAGPDGGGSELAGGAGNDRLLGGDAADDLDGGLGADTLLAGGGDDRLIGDPEGQGLTAPARDVMDGGPGEDVVEYFFRPRAVRVDLGHADGHAGEPGERDLIRSVEDVDGSSGADTLIGSAGPNKMNGGGGNDRILGLGGNDSLIGSPGHDTLDGGAGDDDIRLAGFAPATATDTVRCGTGTDTVTVVPPARGRALLQPLGPTCEQSSNDDSTRFSRPFVSRGIARIRITSQQGTGSGTVSLRSPSGALYGRAAFAGGRARRTVSVHLTPAGRRAARRHATTIVRTARLSAGSYVYSLRL